MRIPSRAACRLAMTGGRGLAALSMLAALAPAAVAPEKTLPGTTIAFMKAPNAADLRAAFRKSQIGQLFDDPAVKPLREDLTAKMEDGSKALKAKVGVTLPELLELPQGAVWIAIQAKDDPKIPATLLISVDAGKNAKVMDEVMAKSTKQAEDSGAKVAEEKFRDLTLHVIQPAKDDDKSAPPLVWARDGAIFHVASDLDALKDVLSHAEGREDSLADSESYHQVLKKVGDSAQAVWFLDIAQVLRAVKRAALAQQKTKPEDIEKLFQLTGIYGLKAAGGSLAFNVGEYDQLTKVFFLSPGPAKGFLKAFAMPKVDLKPEPWVPASAASYESVSWDLDNAYASLMEIANNLGAAPLVESVEKGLVPPNGGEPLSLKKDLFGPLGNRFTAVGDFKKPINEESQRLLFAVALQDAKKFQATLNKLFAIARIKPKTREFQGTTIFDIDIPKDPNAVNGGGRPQFQGPISLAVAKDNLFASSEPALLEQILRGGPSLADQPGYLAVAKLLPEQASVLSYERSEEQARLLYDMVKSGKFQKALQGANMVGGPDADKLGDFLDPDKLPDFAVVAKYLSQGGAFGQMEEDGLTLTRFSLRKVNP